MQTVSLIALHQNKQTQEEFLPAGHHSDEQLSPDKQWQEQSLCGNPVCQTFTVPVIYSFLPFRFSFCSLNT